MAGSDDTENGQEDPLRSAPGLGGRTATDTPTSCGHIDISAGSQQLAADEVRTSPSASREPQRPESNGSRPSPVELQLPSFVPAARTPSAPAHDRSPRDSAPSPESRLSRFNREGLGPGVFAVLFVACGLLLLLVLRAFLADVVIAFILVTLLGGLHRKLTQWLRGRCWLASGMVTLLILVGLVMPLGALAYTIVQDAADAYDATIEFVAASHGPAGFGDWLGQSLEQLGVGFTEDDARALILEAAQGARALGVEWGSALVSNTVWAIVDFLIVLVLVFYLLVDGERLKKFMFELSPLPEDEDAMIIDTFGKVARGVVIGNGVGSAIQGFLGALAMAIAGLASPALWGTVMAALAFLPIVGIKLVVVPAAIALAFQGKYVTSVVFLVFCTVQGLFIENVVKSRLIGSHMRMHDVLVLLSILGGVASFGVVGVVYGPLIAMLFMTFSDLYSQRYRPRMARKYARTHPVPESLPPSTRFSRDDGPLDPGP